MDTPIRFGTDGWRATLDVFTSSRVRMVGQAVATYLADTGNENGTVGICYDARDTSRGFAEDLAEVLAANGHDVLLSDRDRPTPLLAWTIVDRELAGGLMVTASHNPPSYNGVKYIPDDGAPALPAVTDALEARLAKPTEEAADSANEQPGSIHETDFVTAYETHLFDLVGTDAIDGLPVAYDAMHGSGRGVTDAVLERAGASVERLRCATDPTFGGGSPEPNAHTLKTLVTAVMDGDAELGIANDGDADRVAVVTPARGYVDENLLFAALYDYLLETEAGPAVRSVSTTFLVDRIAAAHGERVIETPVGFKWVAAAMADNDALIGGEESGGFTIRGHVREKDGVLVALLIAAMHAAESLDDRLDRLLADHGEIHQAKIGVDCPDGEKARVIGALEGTLPETVAGVAVDRVASVDGYKILLADGSWLLVRPSGTEPMLRVYAEASSEERVEELLEAGRDLVSPLV